MKCTISFPKFAVVQAAALRSLALSRCWISNVRGVKITQFIDHVHLLAAAGMYLKHFQIIDWKAYDNVSVSKLL